MEVERFQKGVGVEHFLIICRTLSHEENYSITEKELVSIVFTSQKFHTYWGRNVVVRTHH